MIRSKRIRRPLAWLAAVAMVTGLIGAAVPIVLCIGADGHVALEAPHASAAIGQTGAWASASRPCGPCVDFAPHISNQKEESLYPALSAPAQPTPPAAAIVSVAVLWPAPKRHGVALPPTPSGTQLDLLRTVVLLI